MIFSNTFPCKLKFQYIARLQSPQRNNLQKLKSLIIVLKREARLLNNSLAMVHSTEYSKLVTHPVEPDLDKANEQLLRASFEQAVNPS